jgi:hypothetical protein
MADETIPSAFSSQVLVGLLLKYVYFFLAPALLGDLLVPADLVVFLRPPFEVPADFFLPFLVAMLSPFESSVGLVVALRGPHLSGAKASSC